MYKAIIFDLDGTLLNTLGDIADCVNAALSRAGFPPHPEDAFRLMVGEGVTKLIRAALPEKTREDEALLARVSADYQKEYDKHYLRRTRPYPGVSELLRELSGQGVRLGVFSNKPHAMTERMVAECFPGISFDLVLGAREGFPLKPNPDGVFEILAVCGAAP